MSRGWGQRASVVPRGAEASHGEPAHPESPVSPDLSGYSSSLREALVPLVADHKCSSPEVYGADISPNMLCAGYFDCKSDACQVRPDLPPSLGTTWGAQSPKGPRPSGPAGEPGQRAHLLAGGQPPGWVLTPSGGPHSRAEKSLLPVMGRRRPRVGLASQSQTRPSCPAKGRAVCTTPKAKPFSPRVPRGGLNRSASPNN